MSAKLVLGGLHVEVARRDVKHVQLTVYPPDGRVRIVAPSGVPMETIRLFAINKLGWIHKQRRALQAQPRETPREFIERESHFLWGRRYLLSVIEHDAAPSVKIRHRKLELRIRRGTDATRRAEVLAAWYRDRIRNALPDLLSTWQQRIGVRANRVYVQHMRTKWGSCNPDTRNIRLNTELAKKPPECLEYILVHELAHLQEPTHGARFQEMMDRLLPSWRDTRAKLNELPLRADVWERK